jgi:hypothetical protein
MNFLDIDGRFLNIVTIFKDGEYGHRKESRRAKGRGGATTWTAD